MNTASSRPCLTRGHGVDGRLLAFQFAYFCISLVGFLLLLVFIVVFPKYACDLMLLFERVVSLDIFIK